MTQNDYALSLLEQGQVQESIPLLRELAWRAPTYASYLNLAAALRSAGMFDDALAYVGRAVRQDPNAPNAWLTLGNIFTDTGNFSQALEYYQGALFRAQSCTNVRMLQQAALATAQAHLRAHEFHEAWPLWELGRFGYSYWALPGTQRWLGEPCRSLLVVCEGGFGDAMLFSRWLPFARSRAKHVKLLIWDRMVSFRDWSELGVDEVLPKSQEIDPAGIDYTTSWMSLPGIAGMRSTLDIPDDQSIEMLPLDPQYVGFCWLAEENCTIRKIRSLPCPEAEALATRLSVYGKVVSLCPRAKHLHRSADEPWPSNVIQDEKALDGWDKTMHVLRNCKFVVTVDTAIAHLAGLRGVPAFLLLPCASDWKWGTAENQTGDPWYGPHVRYYRNSNPWSWDVEDIAVTLANSVPDSCITRP